VSKFVKPIGIVRVRRKAGARSSGRLTAGWATVPCALGKGGVSAAKREGDGATPRGVFRLRRIWIRRDRLGPARCGLQQRRTKPGDGWCDEPRHRLYNRPVALPFSASHETMWRDDHLYDVVIEIGWNDRPAVRGRGSAIFMHLARPGYAPTEGCVALARRDILRLLPRLGRLTRIDIR
jgi:L,D-peptidoglycan transpeptidase YkuD (ErfK/YbiS/YcfS/YnhG family)